MTFSKKVKELLQDPVYHPVFDIRLDPNNQSAEEWALDRSADRNHSGGYVAAGVGGGITGKGAHLLIIDDPLKNAEEADSADTREKLWDWYGSTAYTRLAPGGGVLVVQCMVGDTPVLMADGLERRLDTLAEGDKIATFDRGELSTSIVKGLKSNGRDSILEITTISGRMVRANGRHPFLATVDGELKWIRARNLTTAHRIVALKGSEENGKASLVQQMAALSQQSAEDSARTTTSSRSGLTDIDPLVPTLSHAARPTSNTATASALRTTRLSIWHKAESAPSAVNPQVLTRPSRTTGKANWQSITATTQVGSGDSFVTDATRELDILELSPWHLPQPNTYDFTLDEIASITSAGDEEVFDLQVERTENFIANGLVSHNTWWHDDDLAGRLQVAMAGDPDADQFVVVKYPAIAEHDEYLDYDTDLIVDTEPDSGRLLRLKGEALHPERYDIDKLNQIKRTISPRFWAALYQQNPVPDDGAYFQKEHFRRAAVPHISRCNVFIAWDFAISEKKTNDYTVGTVLLQDDDDRLHVADQVRFKSGDAFFIVEAILNLSKKWHNPTQMLGFEDGQIYRAIEALLKKRMLERKMYPPVTVLKPITDKLARARPLQGRMQQGMVSFNSDAEWYDTTRLEMLRFPAGVHDDCVDSLSWATQMAIGRQAPRKISYKEPPSWRDKLKTGQRGSFMAA
jgi:predicted phage terminase large subunit-like protein